MLTAFALTLVLAPAADLAVIAPDQARNHAGQDRVVRGQVWEVGESEDGSTLFLNFGGSYPFHVFNAVIFEGNLGSFPGARSWKGKALTVSGRIQLYKGHGKPEIILERPEQVTVDSGTTPPLAAVPGDIEGAVETGGASGVLGAPGTGVVMDYDSPPRPIKITRPQYPQEAFINKVEGTVVVEILIDTQGRVARARVIHSVPLLDEAALETAYQWTFRPAVKGGQPVPAIAHAPVAFRIFTDKGNAQQRKQRPVTGPGN